MSSTVLQEAMTAYKKYLIELDYPVINEMTDNDILEIFGKKNRVCLLTWLAYKLIPNYKTPLNQQSSDIENVLANIVDKGFCTDTEKLMISSQGIDTDTEKQIIIFNKIFTYLSVPKRDVRDNENSTQEQQETDDLTREFQKQIRREAKLVLSFGGYLPMLLKNDHPRKAYYRNKLEELRKLVEAADNTTDTEDITENDHASRLKEYCELLIRVKKTAHLRRINFFDCLTTTKKMRNCVRDNQVEGCSTNSSENLNKVLEETSTNDSLQDIPQVPITKSEIVEDED